MDVNNTTPKINRVKRLHTMHNYLFLRHHFHHTNPLIYINSRLQYENTKLTSPYYMNYSYIIKSNFCEGTLRNFDPIKNYFIFSPLYSKTNRPILVPIEYLQCVEGGATKFTYGHTFNLLYRDWMVDKLENRQPSPEEIQIFNHLLALQPHCNADLYPRALAACLVREPEFLAFFNDPDNKAFSSSIERRPQSYTTLGFTDPKNSRDSLISTKTHYFTFFFLLHNFLSMSLSFLLIFLFTRLKIRISSFLPFPGRDLHRTY